MQQLMALDKILDEEYKKKFLNSIQSIIIEDLHGDYFLGHSSNYLPIYVKNENIQTSMMVNVLITEYKDGKLYGKLI